MGKQTHKKSKANSAFQTSEASLFLTAARSWSRHIIEEAKSDLENRTMKETRKTTKRILTIVQKSLFH